MKNTLMLLIVMMISTFAWSQSKVFWKKQSSTATTVLKANHQSLQKFQSFSLNTDALRQALNGVVQRNDFSGPSNTVLLFPNSEGKLLRFSIKEASVMHPDLQARFPEIRSYVGQGVDEASSVLRFSLSPEGFSGMMLSANGNNTFIEPTIQGSNSYIVFNRQNRINTDNDFECTVTTQINQTLNTNIANRNADDSILRTYRLAVSATGEYTQFHGGTKAQALAAIITTMTRVNGIFEVDFNVTTTLIANTDDVIYTNTSSDPYGASSGYNSALQTTLTNIIGEANYDIGHLFAALQNNGNAGCIGCVCVDGQKGSGFTSAINPIGDFFDVDYVAHEMGHQFGANHTWTFNGNEGTNVQVEPGSGTTIMSYAGITGATDVEPNVTPNFHAVSIEQVTDYIKSTSCQINTNTGNAVPSVSAGSNYTIPRSTAFILDGSATDADTPSNALTYSWEQMDENNASSTYPSTTATTGVAFRAYKPTTFTSRYFPRLSIIKTGATSWQWEAIPNVARTLNFRLTVRDNVAGGGANSSDDMIVTVNGTAGPFLVSTPNTNLTWNAGTFQTVTWDVAGTTAAPISCTNVDILLSTDGGDTYPIILASGVTNDGSHDIIVPDNQGLNNRIMVKASNNIFFDISNTDFIIGAPIVCNANTPVGLTASNVGSSTATLDWEALANVAFDIQYRIVETSWNTESAITNTLDLTGLVPLTEYEVQIRSRCPDSSTSSYSESIRFTTSEVQLNYCPSSSAGNSNGYISNVDLNTIDNPTSGTTYSDFTGISTVLIEGSTNIITITPAWSGPAKKNGYSVWIDYNKDGDFNDTGEQVWTQVKTSASSVGGTFAVPTGVNYGSTRMRVSMKFNGIPGPCETGFAGGEVEDYEIFLQYNGYMYLNSSWTPTPGPSANTSAENALIVNGTYTVDSSITLNNLTVNDIATIDVSEGESIELDGNLVNNGNLTLNSTSNQYSSLIVNGTVTGDVTYKRHVNVNASSGGNDLIAAPVTGQTFAVFAGNNPNIVSNLGNPSEKLFGPFDKASETYLTYDTAIPAEAAVTLTLVLAIEQHRLIMEHLLLKEM
jgi:hypothetical protein